ncbi:MAG: YdeI/OmpD-associated family protein, partial [Solirubrobacteraceae bacterium]
RHLLPSALHPAGTAQQVVPGQPREGHRADRRRLDQNPTAREFFATLTGTRRYAFLYRLHNVRTPARRAQRIADYIVRLSEGRTLE